MRSAPIYNRRLLRFFHCGVLKADIAASLQSRLAFCSICSICVRFSIISCAICLIFVVHRGGLTSSYAFGAFRQEENKKEFPAVTETKKEAERRMMIICDRNPPSSQPCSRFCQSTFMPPSAVYSSIAVVFPSSTPSVLSDINRIFTVAKMILRSSKTEAFAT